ncbi:MAG TPA: response regulator [Vicinamibacteria bacterium]
MNPGSHAPLVLVVDDSDDNRDLYAQYLMFRGFRVATAASGEESLERAAQLQPGAVVMDLHMPGMGGWEAVRRLKAEPATRAIPVVVLTADAFPAARTEAEAAGCEGYCHKPCLPQDLFDELERVLQAAAKPSS